jgi:hypothetical protein
MVKAIRIVEGSSRSRSSRRLTPVNFFLSIDVLQDVEQRQFQYALNWTTKILEGIDTSLMIIQKTNSDQRVQAEYLKIVRNKYPDHVLIFTDGSLVNGRTATLTNIVAFER